MIGKKPAEQQMSIFEVALESFIDMNHELVLLSKQIDWEEVESEFAEYYCVDNCRPSVLIRTMVDRFIAMPAKHANLRLNNTDFKDLLFYGVRTVE